MYAMLIEAALSETIPLIAWLTIAGGLLIAALAGGFLIYRPLRHVITMRPRQTFLERELPFYEAHRDRRTIICRDGTLMQMIELQGVESYLADEDRRAQMYQMRKDCLDAIFRIEKVELRFLSINTEHQIEQPAGFWSSIIRRIMDRWMDKRRVGYSRRQIVLLWTKNDSRKAPQRLREAVQTILTTLGRDYKARVLQQPHPDPDKSAGDNPNSWPLSTLARIISPISRHPIPGTGYNVSALLCSDHVAYDPPELPWGFKWTQSNGRVLYGKPISIRIFGGHVDEHMILALSRLPCESVITHVCSPFQGGDPSKVELQLNFKRRRSKIGAVAPHSVEKAWNDLISRTAGEPGRTPVTVWNYNLVMTVYHRDPKVIEEIIETVQSVCAQKGATAVSESIAVLASWFSQWPSFPISWPREWLLTSEQIGCLLALDGAPQGQANCDWGTGPVAVLPTLGGSLYQFQWHIRPPKPGNAISAHTVIIGGTGAGKSTLVQFLLAGTSRFQHHRIICFDSMYGLENCTKIVGGTYIEMDGTGFGMNPFDCDDDEENREHLINLIKLLSQTQDGETAIIADITRFIEDAFTVADRDGRSLETLLKGDLLDSRSELYQRLLPWIDENSRRGRMFNARQDTFDNLSANWITLNFTRLYEDSLLAQATIMYLSHKIRYGCQKRRQSATIFIDEAPRLLTHPAMLEWFKDMHFQYRKRRINVVSAFQDAETITQLGLAAALRGQVYRALILPNTKANAADYQAWDLNDREFSYVKSGGWGLLYSVLAKNYDPSYGDSVILNTDLGGLGEHMIKAFASDDASRDEFAAVYERARNLPAPQRDQLYAHFLDAA